MRDKKMTLIIILVVAIVFIIFFGNALLMPTNKSPDQTIKDTPSNETKPATSSTEQPQLQ